MKQQIKKGANKFLEYLPLWFFILIIGLILMSDGVQAGLIGTFPQGSNVNLIQTCDDCTYNNITSILYPNGTVILSNVQMTKDGTFYNYTLNGNYTNVLGNYIVNGVGDLGGEPTVWAYDFDITPQGWTSTSTFYFIFLIIITLVFTLGVTLKNNYIMFFGSVLVFLLGIFIMVNGVDVIKSTQTTRAIGFVLWGLSIIGIYLSVEGWLNDSELWRGA